MGSAIASDCRRSPVTAESVSSLPPPEQVFLDWLMWLPIEADVQAAARREIARLDRRMPLAPDADRLRTLFLAVLGSRPQGLRRGGSLSASTL
jgi:hypothetical protein